MEPRFSIIIPSYNRAGTLGRAIESVHNQSFPCFEVIVVDDGSTDHSQKVVEAFTKINYFYQENKGVSAARNRGAQIATGDWLIFLDSDDELLPKALEEFYKANNLFIDASVLLGGYILIKNTKETTFIPEKGKYIGHLSGSFAMKKEVFDRLDGYDTSLKFAENTELFFRFDLLNETVGEVHQAVLKYNQPDEGGNNNLVETTKAILYILHKHPYLNNHVKRLYHQILGVNYLRFRKFPEARMHLWKAFLFQPLKLTTLVRWAIALMPFLAEKLYSPNPSSK